MLPDGERRALAERLQAGARAGHRPARRTATRWSGSSATSGAGSTSRSTTSSGRPSRGTARGVQPAGAEDRRQRRHLRGRSTRAATASAARRSSRRRTWSTGSARSTRPRRSGSSEKNYFFRLSKYTQPLLEHFAAHPAFLRARRAAQRDPAPDRGRARGHLDQPRRAVVGHSAAVRPGERGLRLVRRADQLRRRPSATGTDEALFARVVAGRPARHRQGHHALPLRDLAGDADERRPAAARARCSATAGCTSRARR